MKKTALFLTLTTLAGSLLAYGKMEGKIALNWNAYRIELSGSVPLEEGATIQREQYLRNNALFEILEQNSRSIESIVVDNSHLIRNYLDENASFSRKYSYYLQTLKLKRISYSKGNLEGHIEIPMRSQGSLLSILPLPWQQESYQLTSDNAQPQLSAYEDPERYHEYERGRASVKYTGLIIDVSDTDFVPSLAPRIYAEDGKLLYGAEYLNRNTGVHRGIAGFANSLFDPELQKRAGMNPLVTSALSVKGLYHTDAVISTKDARKMFDHDENIKNLLKTRVVFLIK